MLYCELLNLNECTLTLIWSSNSESSSVFTRTQLAKLQLKAIRVGVWFRSLSRIDRVLIDLTIKVADSIRSSQLTKSIGAVVSKLDEMLESKIVRLASTVGRSLAEKIGAVVQGWGYAAGAWSADKSFIVYLAVMHGNKSLWLM